MVLTVNFWQTRGSRLTYDGDVADVENCRLFMAQAEKRYVYNSSAYILS